MNFFILHYKKIAIHFSILNTFSIKILYIKKSIKKKKIILTLDNTQFIKTPKIMNNQFINSQNNFPPRLLSPQIKFQSQLNPPIFSHPNSFMNQKDQDQIQHIVCQNFNEMQSKFGWFKNQLFSSFHSTIWNLKMNFQKINLERVQEMNKKCQNYENIIKKQEEKIKQLTRQTQIMKEDKMMMLQYLIKSPKKKVQYCEQERKQCLQNIPMAVHPPNQNYQLIHQTKVPLPSFQSQPLHMTQQNNQQILSYTQQKPNENSPSPSNERLLIQQKRQISVQEQNPPLEQNLSLDVKLLWSPQNYTIRKVQLQPNKTKISYLRLQYIHCLCPGSQSTESNKFDENDIKSLELYKLQHIQCLKLEQKHISDHIFSSISIMECWKNLKSLYLNDNLITDIKPLQNFNLSEFVQLDISWNPLNEESALFLSQFQFIQLVYFSISFKQGQNQTSWKILLKSQLKNFNSLQMIDIYYQDQLSPDMKKQISNALQLHKTQKIQKVIINWCQSKKQWDKKYGLTNNKITNKIIEKKLLLEYEQWKNKCKYNQKIPSLSYLEPKNNALIPRIKQQAYKKKMKENKQNLHKNKNKLRRANIHKTKPIHKSQHGIQNRPIQLNPQEKRKQQQRINNIMKRLESKYSRPPRIRKSRKSPYSTQVKLPALFPVFQFQNQYLYQQSHEQNPKIMKFNEPN